MRRAAKRSSHAKASRHPPLSTKAMYRAFGKRVFDLGAVALLSPFVLPALLVIALAVRTTLGSPVLFVQQRPGRRARPFTLRKFRTMTDARDAAGDLHPDESRLTRFGRWLRSTSLDELPEFWNVLTGDMSLVGPRPLLMRYLPRYSAAQARRHDVRPGITGLAQVSGRNAATWPDKLARDVEYVDRYSFALDLRILFKTAVVVLRREGISQQGHATMEEFKG